MDDQTILKRTSERLDKWLFRVSAITAAILALSSGVMSYNALRHLAMQAEIGPALAYLFPITLDGLIVSGSMLILFAASRGKYSIWGFLLTTLGVVASIAGNVIVSPEDIISQLVHATPPVVLFLSLEALTNLMRQRIKESIIRAALDDENIETASEFTTTEEKAQTVNVQQDNKKEIPAPDSKKQLSTPTTVHNAEEIKSGEKTDDVDNSNAQKKELDAVETPTVSSAPPPQTPDIPQVDLPDSWADMTVREQTRWILSERISEDISEIVQLTTSKDPKYARRVVREELKS